MEPYSYVGNNPIMFTDPTGMSAEGSGDECGEGGGNPRKGATRPAGMSESEALSHTTTVGGKKYHTYTSNIFASVGNAINSFFGGDNDYFVEKKPFDPADDAFIKEAFDTGAGALAGGIVSKVGGKVVGTIVSKTKLDKVSAEGATWAQKTFGATFSNSGKFAGQTVDDVATLIKNGKIKTTEVPIDVVVRDGKTIILNTRSSIALTKAGIPRSKWTVNNRTGNEFFENQLSGQLKRNKLIRGTNTVRQTGTNIIYTH